MSLGYRFFLRLNRKSEVWSNLKLTTIKQGEQPQEFDFIPHSHMSNAGLIVEREKQILRPTAPFSARNVWVL